MRQWHPSNTHLFSVQLETLVIWFYRNIPVAFGNADGSERWICDRWGDDMGSAAAREVQRLSEQNRFPVISRSDFSYKYDRVIAPKLANLFNPQRELPAGRAPITRVTEFGVRVDGDREVKALATIGVSLDGGVSWLSQTVSDNAVLEDWHD